LIRHSVNAGDGRTLNVAEGGAADGKPVFALHGTPGSILLYPPHVDDAKAKGIRLISYDRPGYGMSSPHPGRKVADAAGDVSAIADSLGLERFAVWGLSGGGPHSLACAALIPKRVVAAASLASPAPHGAEGLDWLAGQGDDNVAEFSAAMAGPLALEEYLGPLREQILAAKPADILVIMDSLLPPPDKAALDGELGGYLTSNMQEGIRPGIEGVREDDLAFVHDWGFDPGDIRIPFLLWQGRHDKMVPYSHGQWLAAHMGGAEARLLPDDGHLTLFRNRVSETHDWLLKHF
jgi:pimeloyl-ACP methyl ester carboxylesterase